MNLTATVIEIAPQDGYAIVRFQLAGTEGDTTTGDCFSVAVTSAAGYAVGQVFHAALVSAVA